MKKKSMFTLLFLQLFFLSISQAQPQKITNLLGYVDYQFEALGKYYFYYLRSDSLWQSDGSSAGTRVLKDLNQGYFIRGSVQKISNAFFFSTYKSGQVTLWKSNGTSAGTVQLATYANIRPIGLLNNEFYYLALTGSTSTLYKVASSGAPAGIKNIPYEYSPINPFYPETAVLTHPTMQGNLYFSLFIPGGPLRWNLWKTNGTSSGTTIAIASSPHSFSNLTEFNGALYFQEVSGFNDNSELWRTNGTSSGTSLVKKFEGRSTLQFIKYKNKFYILSAPYYDYYNYDRPSYLYESDGTTNGTKVITRFPVAQITYFAGIVNGQMAILNGFNDSEIVSYSVNIFRSDGTNAGTKLVKSFNTSTPGINSFKIAVSGNHLIFESYYYSYYGEGATYLIQSDLTPEGTQTIESLYPSYPGQLHYVSLVNVNDVLYFISYRDGEYQLWKYNPNAPVSNIPYFTLVNAATDQDLSWIQEGDTIVKYPGDQINIRYNPVETVGSVRFVLNGSTIRVENVSPYALAGDNSGNYNAWLPSSSGHYTLTAQKYSGFNASGTLLGTTTAHFYIRTEVPGQPPVVNAGADQSIPLPATSAILHGTASDSDGSIVSVNWSFVYGPDTYTGSGFSFSNPHSLNTAVNNLSTAGEYTFRLAVTDNTGLTSYDDVKVTLTGQAVASIYLVNSDNRYFELTDGQTVDITGLTNEFTLLVNTNPEEVGSVRIIFDAINRVENEAPYAAFGNSPTEFNYHSLSNGMHTISATPYTGWNASGTAGITTSITFTIVNTASKRSAGTFTSSSDNVFIQCYPNPSSGSFHITVPVNEDGTGSVFIYDVHGTLLNKLFEGEVQSGSDMNLEWQAYKPGIYFLKTKIANEEYSQKLIVY